MFVTGTRADWSKLQSLAAAAAVAFRIEFFITGMHMLPAYGLTKDEVRKFPGAVYHEFENHQPGDDTTTIHSNTATGLRDLFRRSTPDLLVVHGDRVEAAAACMVAAHMSVRIAHIEGGEVSGSIDNSYRYCCTHYSTSHFVCSDSAERRLTLNGQDTKSILKIGSPELDTHNRDAGVTIQDVLRKYRIPFTEFGIVTFHPVTTETDTMRAQAEELFKNFVVIMPNNDPGSGDIRSVISGLDSARFYRIPNVEFIDFSVLMKNCQAVIGNSSATVRECPFLGIPSLDIGTRQQGRAEGAPSIMHCSPGNSYEIERFFDTMWGKRLPPHFGYGKGNTAREFVGVLLQESFWNLPLQKVYRDVE